MKRNVANPRATGKTAHFRNRNHISKSGINNRNQFGETGNHISPVMQIVKGLLPANKAAQHLVLLIDEPLGNCQKLLCGNRVENAAQLAKLLRSEIGREVLFALMGDERPEWFTKYRKQLDINAARRKLIDGLKDVDALQAEAAE